MKKLFLVTVLLFVSGCSVELSTVTYTCTDEQKKMASERIQQCLSIGNSSTSICYDEAKKFFCEQNIVRNDNGYSRN